MHDCFHDKVGSVALCNNLSWKFSCHKREGFYCPRITRIGTNSFGTIVALTLELTPSIFDSLQAKRQADDVDKSFFSLWKNDTMIHSPQRRPTVLPRPSLFGFQFVGAAVIRWFQRSLFRVICFTPFRPPTRRGKLWL
jgi:hypothetical protein